MPLPQTPATRITDSNLGIDSTLDTDGHLRRWLLPTLLLSLLLLAAGGWRAISDWERETLLLGYLVMLGGFALLLLLIFQLRQSQLKQLQTTRRNMVFGLANLAEMRDADTGKHLERTRGYGVILARTLLRQPKYRQLIDDTFLANLFEAAPLHDLGKVGVPDRVLLKPGRLDQEEFAIMQRHTVIGDRILTRLIDKVGTAVPFLEMSRRIARHHHEKYQGGGYPDGLAGDDIPLEARIYALGDAYDAIRARRPYKEPVTHLEAAQRIYAGRSNHFDPDMVDAFLDCEEQFLELFDSYQVYDDLYLHRESSDEQSGGGIEPAVVWSPEFELGVGVIDRQHRELIDRINLLLDAIRRGRGQAESLKLLRFLQQYVVEHFESEEAYMRRQAYAGYPEHKEMHDAFVAELDELVAEVEKTGVESEHVILINRRVINWVVAHIFLVDKGLRSITQGEQGEQGNYPTHSGT